MIEEKYWKRPGKTDEGHSAMTITDPDGGDRFINFSTSVDIPTNVRLDKFACYAYLHHTGDRLAAAREQWPNIVASSLDDLTESGFAALLLPRLKEDYRFVPEREQWAVWNGSQWVFEKPRILLSRVRREINEDLLLGIAASNQVAGNCLQILLVQTAAVRHVVQQMLPLNMRRSGFVGHARHVNAHVGLIVWAEVARAKVDGPVGTIEQECSSYATPCARSVFVRGNSLEISNGLEDIEGKRFVVVPELEDSQPLNAALLKTISGGDYIAIRPMRGSMRMILPVCKLVLTCNGFPGFPGADAALWARVTPVPFMHAFDEQKLDVHARTKMESNPEVLESILAWAVQGARRNAECQRLGKPAIVPPPELKEFLHQLKLDANPMEQFLDTALIGDAQSEIPASMLITAYTRWCILHGYKAAGTQGIGKFLTEKGFEKVHRRTGNAYVGLVIRPELRDQLVTKLDEDTA